MLTSAVDQHTEEYAGKLSHLQSHREVLSEGSLGIQSPFEHLYSHTCTVSHEARIWEVQVRDIIKIASDGPLAPGGVWGLNRRGYTPSLRPYAVRAVGPPWAKNP
jgi:hypothetical protein